jgi:hypothetical protein
MAAPEGITIRIADPDDAEELTALHLDCWDQAYTGLMALLGRGGDRAAYCGCWRGGTCGVARGARSRG